MERIDPMNRIKTIYGDYETKRIHADNGCIFFFDLQGNETIIQYEDIISLEVSND